MGGASQIEKTEKNQKKKRMNEKKGRNSHVSTHVPKSKWRRD